MDSGNPGQGSLFGMGLLFVGEIHGWSAGISLANGAAEMYWKSTEKVMYILQVRRIPYLNRYVCFF